MTYRIFNHDDGIAIMEWCNAKGITYDVWNAIDVFSWGAERIEIGLEDWSSIPLSSLVLKHD